MACDITTLLADGCTNEFVQAAENEVLFRALVLQLLYNTTGSTDDLGTLLSSACDNGFLQAAQDEQLYRALELQLLCVATGG